MSSAEKLFERVRVLPEPTQAALLQLVEALAAAPEETPSKPKPQSGSAKGLITIGPEFDEPLEDFKPYME